jgi:replicative DNA helicase
LAEAQAIVEHWPLKFDVRPGLTVAQMESAARRQHREWRRQGIKPGPIFVDHIGKVRPGQGRRGDKTAELSDVPTT